MLPNGRTVCYPIREQYATQSENSILANQETIYSPIRKQYTIQSGNCILPSQGTVYYPIRKQFIIQSETVSLPNQVQVTPSPSHQFQSVAARVAPSMQYHFRFCSVYIQSYLGCFCQTLVALSHLV